jgi:cytochrome c556
MRILTIATVVMLVASAVLLFLAYGPKSGKSSVVAAPAQENVSQTLRDMMADAKAVAKAALSREPVDGAELKKARDMIFAAKAKVDQFVEAAKQGPKPYTDAQLAQVMEDIGLKSTMSLLRSLNEKIADLPE